MQDRLSDERNLCPSAYQSVNCDKKKETSTKILIQYERPIHIVFCSNNGGDDPLYS